MTSMPRCDRPVEAIETLQARKGKEIKRGVLEKLLQNATKSTMFGCRDSAG